MQNNYAEKQNAVPGNPEGRITLTPRKETIIEDGEFRDRTDLKDGSFHMALPTLVKRRFSAAQV